jgi:hypothetical protein
VSKIYCGPLAAGSWTVFVYGILVFVEYDPFCDFFFHLVWSHFLFCWFWCRSSCYICIILKACMKHFKCLKINSVLLCTIYCKFRFATYDYFLCLTIDTYWYHNNSWHVKMHLIVNLWRSWKTEINGRGDPMRWPRDTLYPQKLALTSPTSGGHLVGIVHLRTKGHEV